MAIKLTGGDLKQMAYRKGGVNHSFDWDGVLAQVVANADSVVGALVWRFRGNSWKTAANYSGTDAMTLAKIIFEFWPEICVDKNLESIVHAISWRCEFEDQKEFALLKVIIRSVLHRIGNPIRFQESVIKSYRRKNG